MRAASRTGYPESENLLLRSSSLGRRRLNSAVWPRELRLPSPDGSRTIWFTSTSAASRLNRGSTSCISTPPRYRDVDETRDWSRLPISKMINFRIGDDTIRVISHARKREVCKFIFHSNEHCEHFNRQARSPRTKAIEHSRERKGSSQVDVLGRQVELLPH
jgi:hypothetical protein